MISEWNSHANSNFLSASGTSSVLETFRILAGSDYVPYRTIEFHGYAAEEAGLLGSADIVK
jgi:leucyl aminopeptidase